MPKQDKTFVRTGAGEIWIDDSLKDWPENDYRIFVGDLGKETTTEMLAKIFQVYKSFAKAKVLPFHTMLFSDIWIIMNVYLLEYLLTCASSYFFKLWSIQLNSILRCFVHI